MAARSRSPRASALAADVPRGVQIPISTGFAELRDEADGSVTVYVNGVPSSTLRADLHLDFEYMRHEAAAIAAWDADRPDHAWLALHIGAAACTLPRHLAAAHPASRHIAVDIDTTLAELARIWWDLPRAPRLRVRAQDGLEAVTERQDASLDLVVRDAFSGDSVPAHLASAEWWSHAARVVRAGGLVVANVAVAPGSGISEARDARDAFAQVAAIGEHAVLKRKRRGNVVLVARTERDENLSQALSRYAASAPLPTGVDPNWA
ncbi:spermidine synthase [Demequina sp.]|uniref:spermidine synthase n=1 Tax=Demequina sp. TaxID=2050685 RepID=UPI003D0C8311